MHISAQPRAEVPCLPLLGAVTAARFSFLPLALQRGRRRGQCLGFIPGRDALTAS